MIHPNNQKIDPIAEKHGLPTHDPIQQYHYSRAMQEYADQQTSELKAKYDLLLQINLVQADRLLSIQSLATARSQTLTAIAADEILELVDPPAKC